MSSPPCSPQDGTQNTPLHAAALAKSIDCARVLVEAGVHIDGSNVRNSSSCYCSFLSLCRLTLACMHACTLCQGVGQTALHLAAMHGNVAMSIELMRMGANMDCLDVVRYT